MTTQIRRLGAEGCSQRACVLALCLMAACADCVLAAQIDLLDFQPSEAGLSRTLTGTAHYRGKALAAKSTIKLVSIEAFGRITSSSMTRDFVAGPVRWSVSSEDEADSRGIRPIRTEMLIDGRRVVNVYDAWNTPIARIVELGKSYPYCVHYNGPDGGVTITGTMLYLTESISSPLGLIECVRRTTRFEKTYDEHAGANVQGDNEDWLARGIGLVRSRMSFSYQNSTVDVDLTIDSTSQPVTLQPVFKAKF